MASGYFVWDIERIIFHIYGPLALRWYSLLFLGGMLLGNHLFLSMAKKEGKMIPIFESCLYFIIIGTVVGARLGHVLFYGFEHYMRNPLDIFKVWEGGLASHGGYLGVIVAMIVFVTKHGGNKFSFLWLADRIAICALMAGGFIRLGNFFNSEIYGKVTDVPWAVIFAQVDGLPRHPSQIYEALGYFLISFVTYLVYLYYGRNPREGRLLGLILSLGFSYRFLIEGLKVNQESFENGMFFNMGQWLSVPFVIVGLLLIYGISKEPNGSKSRSSV